MKLKISTSEMRNSSKIVRIPHKNKKLYTAGQKSLVEVFFPGRNLCLTYYNDRFDLHPGDLVYVDGKLEGQLGKVTEVSHNFKIKLSEYRRVVGVADTKVTGRFFMVGQYFITFWPSVLPASKVATWFFAPGQEGDQIVSATDGSAFSIEKPEEMPFSTGIAQRGENYNLENRVQYLSLNGSRGYGIVEGTQAYEVEFQYQKGKIRELLCSCPCTYPCKHEYAALLQLKDILQWIATHHKAIYEKTGYFAIVSKRCLFDFAIGSQESGSITL